MNIALEREGTFSVRHTKSNKAQCGSRGTSVLHYKVRIEGRPEDLNDNGYLLDNNSIPDYFAKKFRNIPHFKSCEDIAKEACHEFCQAVGKEGGRCRRVTVSISGIQGSWITADMYQGGETLTSAAVA